MAKNNNGPQWTNVTLSSSYGATSMWQQGTSTLNKAIDTIGAFGEKMTQWDNEAVAEEVTALKGEYNAALNSAMAANTNKDGSYDLQGFQSSMAGFLTKVNEDPSIRQKSKSIFNAQADVVPVVKDLAALNMQERGLDLKQDANNISRIKARDRAKADEATASIEAVINALTTGNTKGLSVSEVALAGTLRNSPMSDIRGQFGGVFSENQMARISNLKTSTKELNDAAVDLNLPKGVIIDMHKLYGSENIHYLLEAAKDDPKYTNMAQDWEHAKDGNFHLISNSKVQTAFKDIYNKQVDTKNK